MRAVVCDAWGPPESLRIGELPLPEPGPGQVRVRVHAAAANYPDALMVAGKYQFRPELPFAPGLEFSGVVSAVGDGVDTLHPGDKVVGTATHGAFAEEVVAGWLVSPGHCANLMDPRFRHTGVGVAEGSRTGEYYWVQTFGAPGG